VICRAVGLPLVEAAAARLPEMAAAD